MNGFSIRRRLASDPVQYVKNLSSLWNKSEWRIREQSQGCTWRVFGGKNLCRSVRSRGSHEGSPCYDFAPQPSRVPFVVGQRCSASNASTAGYGHRTKKKDGNTAKNRRYMCAVCVLYVSACRISRSAHKCTARWFSALVSSIKIEKKKAACALNCQSARGV